MPPPRDSSPERTECAAARRPSRRVIHSGRSRRAYIVRASHAEGDDGAASTEKAAGNVASTRRDDRRDGADMVSATVTGTRAAGTNGRVKHHSAEELVARGKAARVAVPRATMAEFTPTGRDAIAMLEEQAVSRLPDLVPIRYGRMLESPFAFYRGAALVMASDLAATPTTGLRVQ